MACYHVDIYHRTCYSSVLPSEQWKKPWLVILPNYIGIIINTIIMIPINQPVLMESRRFFFSWLHRKAMLSFYGAKNGTKNMPPLCLARCSLPPKKWPKRLGWVLGSGGTFVPQKWDKLLLRWSSTNHPTICHNAWLSLLDVYFWIKCRSFKNWSTLLDTGNYCSIANYSSWVKLVHLWHFMTGCPKYDRTRV